MQTRRTYSNEKPSFKTAANILQLAATRLAKASINLAASYKEKAVTVAAPKIHHRHNRAHIIQAS